MINKERLLERFLSYVKIDSPTKSELEFAKLLKAELEEMGFQVYMDDAGEKLGSNSGNLLARLEGKKEAKALIFSAHMDTVSPSIGIRPEIRDGVIYSDGTTILASDDKAGVAAILEGVETALENKLDHGDIEISFTIFEEGGLNGVKNLDFDRFKAREVFVLDSGGSPGEIIVEGPAQNKLDISFIGKKAHAGVAPEEGISAIEMAAEAISNMDLLRIDPETTANIGSINGGEATNIVTERVDIRAEARSLDNEKLEKQTQTMIRACQAAAEKYKGSLELDVKNAYGAFKIDEDEEIVKNAKRACRDLGLEAYTAKSGGGSDTNIWNQNGFKAVNLGVGMKNAHTVEEHISIEDLENSAALVLKLIEIYA